MAEPSSVDELLSQYSGAPTDWPTDSGGQRFFDRANRDQRREMAWDAATGDPNYGYASRLPAPFSGARAAVMDNVVRPTSEALFGWMTPEERERLGVAANFAGPAAPLLKGIFLTPAKAALLEAAGLRGGSAWGGLDALDRARQQWARGAAATPEGRAEIWRDLGWYPRGRAWGDDTAFPGAPFTVAVDPGRHIAPEAIRALADRRPGEKMTARAGDLIREAPEFFAADPRLRDLPILFGDHPRSDTDLSGIARLVMARQSGWEVVRLD
jgi:hypothetical protein